MLDNIVLQLLLETGLLIILLVFANIMELIERNH